jgi:sorbose reductase
MDSALISGTSKFSHYNTQAPDTTRILPLFSLKGKTAIVAGAGAGIGLAVARGFCEAGANVIIWYNSNKAAQERASELEKEFGVKCRAYSVDVTDSEAVEKAILDQVKGFGDRLDICVYNSGAAWTSGAAVTGSLENYQQVMKVNVDGLFFFSRIVGRVFREQKQRGLENFRAGSLIVTSSMSGHITNFPQMQAAYNASKAAAKHLAQNLAIEWVQFARVNSISPVSGTLPFDPRSKTGSLTSTRAISPQN